MKNLVIGILFSVAANAHAFTSCVNADGTFKVSVYESNPITVLISDSNVSVAPNSYICEKSTLTEDNEQLSAYSCIGGSRFGAQKNVILYINESKGKANYHDQENEDNDKTDLGCEITE